MQTRLTNEQVKRARELGAKGLSQKKIAKAVKASQTAISFLLRGKTYASVK